MESDKYTDVFLRLQSNYILLYIHDINDYSVLELEKLASRLEKQLPLDGSAEEINQELAQKSEYNVK